MTPDDWSDAPADEGLDEDDAALLTELRAVAGRAEPVPDDLAEMARGLLSWRDPDAAVAELVADSRQLAGSVRGDDDLVLHFRTGDTEIVIQLTTAGPGALRLVGQVEPASPGTIRVRRFGEQFEVDADDLGRFVADGLGPGPLSLRWQPAGADRAAVETAWQLV